MEYSIWEFRRGRLELPKYTGMNQLNECKFFIYRLEMLQSFLPETSVCIAFKDRFSEVLEVHSQESEVNK